MVEDLIPGIRPGANDLTTLMQLPACHKEMEINDPLDRGNKTWLIFHEWI